MKKLTLVLLLLLITALLQVCTVVAAYGYNLTDKWVLVTFTKNSKCYVKKGPNEPVGIHNTETPSCWFKNEYLKPEKDSKKLIKTSISQILFNCNKRSTAIKQIINYYTDESNNMNYISYINEMSFKTVIPDSVGEDILNHVCSKEPQQNKTPMTE